ncbi:hypothetical protein [Rhodoplanes sp. SY1]|uniref:hypothetical protein n=1 Tax=Rhodoplanes sp. SY1 TaxID=3166646 RepID=UPI0038B62D41
MRKTKSESPAPLAGGNRAEINERFGGRLVAEDTDHRWSRQAAFVAARFGLTRPVADTVAELAWGDRSC